MKAILEIEMPDACTECQVKDSDGYCLIIHKYVSNLNNFRHPDCPLEIIDDCTTAEKTADGKCVGYQKSDIDDEPAEMCMECSRNQFYVGE